MSTNHLSTKQLFNIAELEIWLVASWHPLLTQCLNRTWPMIRQRILHTSREGAYEERLAAL